MLPVIPEPTAPAPVKTAQPKTAPQPKTAAVPKATEMPKEMPRDTTRQLPDPELEEVRQFIAAS